MCWFCTLTRARSEPWLCVQWKKTQHFSHTTRSDLGIVCLQCLSCAWFLCHFKVEFIKPATQFSAHGVRWYKKKNSNVFVLCGFFLFFFCCYVFLFKEKLHPELLYNLYKNLIFISIRLFCHKLEFRFKRLSLWLKKCFPILPVWPKLLEGSPPNDREAAALYSWITWTFVPLTLRHFLQLCELSELLKILVSCSSRTQIS